MVVLSKSLRHQIVWVHWQAGPEVASHEQLCRAVSRDLEWSISVREKREGGIRSLYDALRGLDRPFNSPVAAWIMRAADTMSESIRCIAANSAKACDVNCGPPSDRSVSGTPKRANKPRRRSMVRALVVGVM